MECLNGPRAVIRETVAEPSAHSIFELTVGGRDSLRRRSTHLASAQCTPAGADCLSGGGVYLETEKGVDDPDRVWGGDWAWD